MPWSAPGSTSSSEGSVVGRLELDEVPVSNLAGVGVIKVSASSRVIRTAVVCLRVGSRTSRIAGPTTSLGSGEGRWSICSMARVV